MGGYAGGGASLSQEGREFLNEYKTFKQEIDLQLEQFINRTASKKQLSSINEAFNKNSSERHLLLASTMEPVETGLLDVLEGAFFQATGVLVRHIALGSGRALEMARTGRVDMVLTHAPEIEEEFLLDGWGKSRIPVMANDFILAGPSFDSAGLKMLDRGGGAKEAFRQIAYTRAPFISRGDRSGTQLRELQIWESAGIYPKGEWYIVSSGIVGNRGILRLALEQQAYALVDRATFLLSSSQNKMNIFIGTEEGNALPGELENIFSLLLVNPERVPFVNFEDALLFAKWIQGKEAQRVIAGFGEESYNRPLFSRVVSE